MTTKQILTDLANGLLARAEFHRRNTNDPHGIGTAAYAILLEVGETINTTAQALPDVDAKRNLVIEKILAGDPCERQALPNPDQRRALREIKLTALTTKDGQKGLAHIVRLCIDAGVSEHYDELQKMLSDEARALADETQSEVRPPVFVGQPPPSDAALMRAIVALANDPGAPGEYARKVLEFLKKSPDQRPICPKCGIQHPEFP